MRKNNDIDIYGLELLSVVNNLDNKRQGINHNITIDELEMAYKSFMPLLSELLSSENAIYDEMGDEDLNNYEKWLKWWLMNLNEANYIMQI